MLYPQKMNSKKSNLILKFSISISIITAILLLIINKYTTPDIPWAAFTNAGIIYVWIVVFYSIYKNINIAGHVLLQIIAISILTIFIDNGLGYKGWSINLAIPILIIISNITMLVLTIVNYNRFVKYAIYQLIIVLFSMLPIIFIKENIVQNKTLSILSSAISMLNLVISLILCTKDIKEAIIRKFHI